MNADLAKREKAWRVLFKNASGYIEEILEATSLKTTAVRPLTSYR